MRVTIAGLQAEVAALNKKLAVSGEPKLEVVGSFSYKLNHQAHGGAPYESSDHFQSLKVLGGVPLSEVEYWQGVLDASAKKAVLRAANAMVVALHDGTLQRTVNDIPPRESAPRPQSTDEQVREVRNHAIAQQLRDKRMGGQQ